MSTDTTAEHEPGEGAVHGSETEAATWDDASAQVEARTDDPADSTDSPQTPPAPAAGDNAAAPGDATSRHSRSETDILLAEDGGVARRRHVPRHSRSETDILLDGSSVVGRPSPRTAAHWAGVLVWVVALPLSWFLLHDGAAKAVDGAAPLTFGTPGGALAELGAGAVVLALALWTASRSSLGAFVVGAVSLLIGLPFLLVPTAMNGVVGPLLDRLTAHSDLGASLSAYFWADAVSGRFIAFGVFMIMVGVVSHSARRSGRGEQRIMDRRPEDE